MTDEPSDEHWMEAAIAEARLAEAAGKVDGWFDTASDLPTELASGIEIYPLKGGKSPMEPAIYLKSLQAIYFADVVRSHASGVLRLLPDEKLKDAGQVASSLGALAGLPVEAVLLGDGDSIYNGARAALDTLL